MRPAILIIFKKDEIIRTLFCEDHNDALDIAKHYETDGHHWVMSSPEIVKQGETVDNLPPIQQLMFEDND